MLGNVLRAEGYTVVTQSTGRALMSYFKIPRVRVDLLILDIKMPVPHGVQIIQHIHSIRAQVPIIIYTAYPEMKDIPELYTYGINSIVIKEEWEKLIEEVNRILG